MLNFLHLLSCSKIVAACNLSYFSFAFKCNRKYIGNIITTQWVNIESYSLELTIDLKGRVFLTMIKHNIQGVTYKGSLERKALFLKLKYLD